MVIKATYYQLKRLGRLLLFGAFFMLFTGTLLFAQRTVTGTVTSASDGLSLPGVNVIVQGTATGTITDVDGNFSLDVPGGDVSLQFSFIGYEVQVIAVGSSTVIDVTLEPSLHALDEVVVTSLGIKREKKQITYSAQNLDSESITQARDVNITNSMQGKIAGVDIIKASSGVGGASRVIIRGNNSIAGNNQPLYIVDGVPINNSSWSTPSSDNGGIQTGDGISNINADDVESMTVLKGPNATALYGSRAANGAIVITTKKGSARKGIGVEFNTNTAMEKALILTQFQHEYGQGAGGNYVKTSELSWGPRMTGQMVEHWTKDPSRAGETYAYSPHNNFEEFFQTGLNTTNTLTLTSGTDKIRTLFSYSRKDAKGIVETNKLKSNNFNVRIDGNLSDKLSFDAKLTYFNQHVDNRLHTGDSYANEMRALYRQPSNISLEEARNFEYFLPSGERRHDYWNWPTNGGENIYWMVYRDTNQEDRNRVLGMGSLKYQFTEGLSLMFRSAFDQTFDHWENRKYNWTYTIADAGHYGINDINAMEVNNDLLLNYTHNFGDMLSLNASVGGNMLHQKSGSRSMRTNRLLKPDFFSIGNTSQVLAGDGYWEKKINSVYGFATFGLKDFLFLDVTARNDWSSTLPKENWSYFYPSVGLTWILTEMLDTSSDLLTFAKLRASYAEVGNDTGAYAIHNTYGFGSGGQAGYAWRSGTLAATGLMPENTKSTEFGFDVRLFQNRLGVDFTWYKSNTFNQLLRVPLPIASGYSSKFINAGNVQNQGVEIILNATPLVLGDFRWDMTINYAQNENLLIELTDDMDEYTTRGRSWMTTHKVVVGEEYDQIFVRGFMRENDDPNGRMLVNSLGLPLTTPGQTVMGGSGAADWSGGFSNSFSWKGINLSALIDARMGGMVYSFTEANLTSDGFSAQTLEGRDGFVVDGLKDDQDYEANPDGDPIWVENDIVVTSEEYWMSLGGRNSPIGGAYGYDASFVRLREVLLGYTIQLNSSAIQSIGLSLYGRNLGFLYNASGIIDPGMSMGVGNIQGVEGFALPTTRTFGINARFKF
ncbi:MAG: SusC/RagA family TonB-linked outer membrane protein [Bacteroidota bacterium]